MRKNAHSISRHIATLALSALLVACSGDSDPVDEAVDPDAGSGGGGENTETGIGGSPLLDGGEVADSNIACNTGQGTDNDSVDESWNNNCYVQVDPTPDDLVSETFAKSFYTEGIQRIVWCLGHSPDFDRESFVDRDFGPRTRAAVESFQEHQGLSVDGIVGLQTWEAMQNSLVEVGSDSFSVAWAVGDAFYPEIDDPIFENDCQDQPVFWEYLAPDANVKAWTLTDKDENDSTDTTTFGGTEEKFFGNTF